MRLCSFVTLWILFDFTVVLVSCGGRNKSPALHKCAVFIPNFLGITELSLASWKVERITELSLVSWKVEIRLTLHAG